MCAILRYTVFAAALAGALPLTAKPQKRVETLELTICGAKVTFEVFDRSTRFQNQHVWDYSTLSKPGSGASLYMTLGDFGVRFLREPRAYAVIEAGVWNIRGVPGFESGSAFATDALLAWRRSGTSIVEKDRNYSIVTVGGQKWIKCVELYDSANEPLHDQELYWTVPLRDDVILVLRFGFGVHHDSRKLIARHPDWYEEARAFQDRVFNSLQVVLPPGSGWTHERSAPRCSE